MSRAIRQNPPCAEDAVLYLRLSSADDPAAESDSIQNQRSFLQEWAAAQGFRILREFVDDGHTGTDFERPGFQELNRCLMDGSVRCIIVKDYCAIIGLNQKDLENQGILA